jgi:hypothetical protein
LKVVEQARGVALSGSFSEMSTKAGRVLGPRQHDAERDRDGDERHQLRTAERR